MRRAAPTLAALALARALDAAGVRNRTEVGTADLCPVAL